RARRPAPHRARGRAHGEPRSRDRQRDSPADEGGQPQVPDHLRVLDARRSGDRRRRPARAHRGRPRDRARRAQRIEVDDGADGGAGARGGKTRMKNAMHGRCAPFAAALAFAATTIAFAAAPLAAQPVADLSLGGGLSAEPATRWSGWIQADTAYAWRSPGHFTHLRTLGEIAGRGQWGQGFKWRLSARANLDGAYAWSDHYPRAVREDQRAWARLHEAYVDFSRGDWEFRIGKQNVVWGEMVGLFFADVVSAKDLRDTVLPEFDLIRIPQWAARAEWYRGDSHLELVWLPWPEVDDIGKPGAEFYPFPPRFDGFG